MYWQKEIIRDSVSLDLNSTYKLDLPETGILNSLMLYVVGRHQTGNPTGSINLWRPRDYIDNISVIANGATVVKSLTARQLAFLTMLDQKVVPPAKWIEYSQNYNREVYLLNFGRFFGDKEMGLDLSKFDSVELQVKNVMTNTYFQSLTLTIVANYLREAAGGLVGYMRTENWRSWTTVADETKYLDLPTEHVIRRIALQALPDVDSTTKMAKTTFWNLMYDIEANLKTGVLRMYKGGLEKLAFINAFEIGLIPQTAGFIYHAADKGFEVGVGYPWFATVGANTKDDAGAAVIPTMSSEENTNTQKMETYEGDTTPAWVVNGLAYENCVLLPFDQDPNPYTWLDPEANKVVQLNIKTRNDSNAAGGTNNVVLDRLVRY
jgi:hypothetical protein